MYHTLKEYTTDKILPLISRIPKTKTLLEELEVGISSLRLQTFRRSQKCVKCDRVGTIFKLECHIGKRGQNHGSYHLNLYAIDSDGSFHMMTADHIIPISKGGPRHFLGNLQTMCRFHNHEKANNIEPSMKKPDYSDAQIQKDLEVFRFIVPKAKRIRRKLLRFIRLNRAFVKSALIKYKIDQRYMTDLNTNQILSTIYYILEEKSKLESMSEED